MNACPDYDDAEPQQSTHLLVGIGIGALGVSLIACTLNGYPLRDWLGLLIGSVLVIVLGWGAKL